MNKKNVSVKFFIFVLISLVFISLSGAFVSAARTISSVTLNGASSVNVDAEQSITAAVTVQVTNPSTWGSTKYKIGSGSTACVNHNNHNPGTFTETFAITSPSDKGNYNFQVWVYRTDDCTLYQPGNIGGETLTLSNPNGIHVVSVCGDSIADPDEVCDSSSQSCTDANGYAGTQPCNSQCSGWDSCIATEYCGDSIVNGNEQCDGEDCCNADCTFISAQTECRTAQGQCDVSEYCTGSDATCPSDSKSTEQCRDSAGVCDIAESCDGINNDCPNDEKSTAECRAVTSDCDLAETCTGVNNDCPDDSFKSEGTSCNDGIYCTIDDQCDATGNCITSTPRDCSGNDIFGINTCENSPDDNPFTFDFRNAFTSVCDEGNDVCLTGDETISHTGNDNDGDGYASNCGDCNDIDSNINPGATEVCNGMDDNCDENIDEEGVCPSTAYYCDGDSDGYISATPSGSCDSYNCTPAGCQEAQGDDCDDTNPEIYQVLTAYQDNDGDTYTVGDQQSLCSGASLPEGYQAEQYSEDCNDVNVAINPGATEVCNNVDDNCEGNIDEALVQSCGEGDCTGTQTCSQGAWGDCSSGGSDCGICAICNVAGTCVFDGTQNSDCSGNNLLEIATCNNEPDDNVFTWDYAAAFNSECAGLNTCSQESQTVTSTCNVLNCGAQCEANENCANTDCSDLHGCYFDGVKGDVGIYRSYSTILNICDLETCGCSQNECSVEGQFLSEADDDEDGYSPSCGDNCDNDINKLDPGICGCDTADTDSDEDGAADCNDNCINVANPDQADKDEDGFGDLCDLGQVTLSLVSPSEPMIVIQKQPFNFTVDVSCAGGDCGDVTATLDPQDCNGGCIDLNVNGKNIKMDSLPRHLYDGYGNDIDTYKSARDYCLSIGGDMTNFEESKVWVYWHQSGSFDIPYYWYDSESTCAEDYRCSTLLTGETPNKFGWHDAYGCSCYGHPATETSTFHSDMYVGDGGSDMGFICSFRDKGIIPMNLGTPFFTTTQNPMSASDIACLGNMADGTSCSLTWEVNPTGTNGTKWQFYVIYNSTSNATEKESGKVEITIIDYDIDEDGFENTIDDCDDNNAAINPNTIEICDGADNNCDGQVDENNVCSPVSYYCDNDADGVIDTNPSGSCNTFNCENEQGEGCQATAGTDTIIGTCTDIKFVEQDNVSNIICEVDGAAISNTESGNKNVKLKDAITLDTIIEFDYNFGGSNILNLSGINITVDPNIGEGSIIIKGINLTGQGLTKTAYINKISSTNTICIIDAEVASIAVTDDCTNGYKVICDGGNNGPYNCTTDGSRYKIMGLNHSAATQYSYTAPTPPSGGGGGGSSGGGSRRLTNLTTPPVVVPVPTTPKPVKAAAAATPTPATQSTAPAEQPVQQEAAQPDTPGQEVTPPKGMFAITGAFIGNAITSKWGIVSGIILLVLLLTGFVTAGRLRRREKENTLTKTY